VVMQATTAQNDLIAAALIGCASALILHGGNRSLILAGIAVGVALGVKLTAILALPILGLLALTYGWRGLRAFGLAAVLAAMTLGAGGIWRNLDNTSHLLGHGGGRVEYETDAALGSTLLTSYRVGYRLLDLSGLRDLVLLLTTAGIVTVGVAYVALRRRRLPVRDALIKAFLIALPLLTPVIFAAIAGSLEGVAKATSVNVNPSSSTSGSFVWGVHTIAELPELLPAADVVVLIVPLTAATTGMVDADFLARMKDGALLVNAARGPVVDTDALVVELAKGRLGAAMDVTDPEPLPPGHPLWSMPNVLMTPHVAGSVGGLWKRAYGLAGDQIRRYAAGEPLINVVAGDY